jgi:hypothetical protein
MLCPVFVKLLGDQFFKCLGAYRTQNESAATVPENRNQSGPYITAFSLHVPDMRVEIAKNLRPLSPFLSNRCLAIEHLSDGEKITPDFQTG